MHQTILSIAEARAGASDWPVVTWGIEHAPNSWTFELSDAKIYDETNGPNRYVQNGACYRSQAIRERVVCCVKNGITILWQLVDKIGTIISRNVWGGCCQLATYIMVLSNTACVAMFKASWTTVHWWPRLGIFLEAGATYQLNFSVHSIIKCFTNKGCWLWLINNQCSWKSAVHCRKVENSNQHH